MGKLKKKPKAAKPPEVGEVMTLPEAAAYLRVDEAALKSVVDSGQLPGRLIGNQWRFHRDAVDSWLRSGWGEHSGGGLSPPRQYKSMPSLEAISLEVHNSAFLDAIGSFADDDTLEPMVEEIYRQRHVSGGGDE